VSGLCQFHPCDSWSLSKFPETFSPQSGEERERHYENNTSSNSKRYYSIPPWPPACPHRCGRHALRCCGSDGCYCNYAGAEAALGDTGIRVGTAPAFAAADPATNTIYVSNYADNTISVIDGNRCNARNASRCAPIATITNVGFGPSWLAFDRTTRTLYITDALTESGDLGNQVAVLNVAHCNAYDTSGCSEAPVALVTIAGDTGNGFDASDMALDSRLHTLYVSDSNFGPLSMINTATCNALQTSGCNQVATTTTATGFGVAIDHSNHSVYLSDLVSDTMSVFNGGTCNAETQSDCSAVSVAQLSPDFLPYMPAIDPFTHSVYLPLFALTDSLGYTGVIDGSTCNGTNHSGCGQTPGLVQTGSIPLVARFDPTTRTVYVISEDSSTLSVIDAASCNGPSRAGCPSTVPALAVGFNSIDFVVNSQTHTIYAPSLDTNAVWVLDVSKCNGQRTSGCTDFAPITTIGLEPAGITANRETNTAYVNNRGDNTVSVIDTTVCNAQNQSGCKQNWPTIAVGATPQWNAINRITDTLYVLDRGENVVSVINGATRNAHNTSGCAQIPPTTLVGD
jgi:DNA-binding beta-propeller fold protein YncE